MDPKTGPPGFHWALAKHTGFLLSRIGMVAQRRFGERLASLGLNPRMWAVLNVLDAEGPITQHALGQCVGTFVEDLVENLQSLIGQADLVGVRVEQEPRHLPATVGGGDVPVLAPDVASWLLYPSQERLDLGPEGRHVSGQCTPVT